MRNPNRITAEFRGEKFTDEEEKEQFEGLEMEGYMLKSKRENITAGGQILTTFIFEEIGS
jgi:hypothetical protein